MVSDTETPFFSSVFAEEVAFFFFSLLFFLEQHVGGPSTTPPPRSPHRWPSANSWQRLDFKDREGRSATAHFHFFLCFLFVGTWTILLIKVLWKSVVVFVVGRGLHVRRWRETGWGRTTLMWIPAVVYRSDDHVLIIRQTVKHKVETDQNCLGNGRCGKNYSYCVLE